MWVDLPNLWVVILNVIVVPVIHLGVSWVYTNMDSSRFDPAAPIFREQRAEKGGEWYHIVFRVRSWKRFLPDAAAWFEGFEKGSLDRKTPEYLRAFIVETCRGEAAHYAQILGLLVTLIWNPWPVAAGFMIIYAFASNLPCLISLRFTRARLRQLLGRMEAAR